VAGVDTPAPPGPVVVYCAYGHEISQGLVAALRAMGADARQLEGGIAAWREAGLAVIALDAEPSARADGETAQRS